MQEFDNRKCRKRMNDACDDSQFTSMISDCSCHTPKCDCCNGNSCGCSCHTPTISEPLPESFRPRKDGPGGD